MKTLKTTLWTALTCLLLTACGGGSSDPIVLSPVTGTGGSTNTNNNNANNGNSGSINNGNTNTGGFANVGSKKDTQANPTTLNTSIQGVVATIDTKGTTSISSSAATPAINTVVIGGKNIELGSNLRTGGGLTNVRYGYLSQNGITPTLIAQGITASQVPTTGKATYKGNAVHLTAGVGSQVVPANFVADFDKKVLTGTINAAGGIAIGGNISGNRFTGKVGDYSTTGYFYGEKADELGGIYKNTDGSSSGAYGAKK